MAKKEKTEKSAFEKLTRALIGVPKDEIDQKEREYRRKRAGAQRKRKPKPS